jgi:uncharacterized membrane protein YkvA (DUF1232 family)
MTEKTPIVIEDPAQTDREQSRRSVAEKLKTPIRQFLKQFRVIRRALVHPQVPWYAKGVAGCAVLYVFSPIQLLPNFIPIIGQMDDVLVVSLGIKFLRRCLPVDVLEDCENEAYRSLPPTIPAGSVMSTLPGSKS